MVRAYPSSDLNIDWRRPTSGARKVQRAILLGWVTALADVRQAGAASAFTGAGGFTGAILGGSWAARAAMKADAAR
jgi:hypothetical protein